MFEAKMVMEYLFPKPSPYEIVDYSILNLSYNIVYSLEEKIRINNKEIMENNRKINTISIKNNFFLFIFFILFKIYKLFIN